MTNNDIFKKVKIATSKLSGLKDAEFKECFRLGGYDITVSNFDSYKVSTENRRYKPMPDDALEAFLNGIIEFANEKAV